MCIDTLCSDTCCIYKHCSVNVTNCVKNNNTCNAIGCENNTCNDNEMCIVNSKCNEIKITDRNAICHNSNSNNIDEMEQICNDNDMDINGSHVETSYMDTSTVSADAILVTTYNYTPQNSDNEWDKAGQANVVPGNEKLPEYAPDCGYTCSMNTDVQADMADIMNYWEAPECWEGYEAANQCVEGMSETDPLCNVGTGSDRNCEMEQNFAVQCELLQLLGPALEGVAG